MDPVSPTCEVQSMDPVGPTRRVQSTDHVSPTCVVQSMDHVSLIDIRKVFLLQYLDIQVLFPCKKDTVLLIPIK